jgi:hypothetical protein
VTLKADGGAEWELGGNRVMQVSILQQELQLDRVLACRKLKQLHIKALTCTARGSKRSDRQLIDARLECLLLMSQQ